MKFLMSKRAESFISMIIAVLVIFTIIATISRMFPLYITKAKVDAMASQLVRVIELTGSVGSEYYAELNELKADTGLDPTITITPSKTQYQLREQFTLTISVTQQVKIFTPASGDPPAINVPITKTVTGRSEVYFKP